MSWPTPWRRVPAYRKRGQKRFETFWAGFIRLRLEDQRNADTGQYWLS